METNNKQATAQLNDLRISPRKVRLVASLLRGLSVNEAEAQLLFQTAGQLSRFLNFFVQPWLTLKINS